MDVGCQARFLESRNLFGIEFIVDVRRYEVRVGRLWPGREGDGKPPQTGHAVDPLDEFLRIRALGDLSTDLPHLGRGQFIVKPCQQGSESQSHPKSPVSYRIRQLR